MLPNRASAQMNYYHNHAGGNMGGDTTHVTFNIVAGKGWDKSATYNNLYVNIIGRSDPGNVTNNHAIQFRVVNGVAIADYPPFPAYFDVSYLCASCFPQTDSRYIQADTFIWDNSGNPMANTSVIMNPIQMVDHSVESESPVLSTYQMSASITVDLISQPCNCECQSGKVTPGVGSVDVRIDMGKGVLGEGHLTVHGDLPAPGLASPVSLNVSKTSEFSQLNSGNYPRQVLSPQALADIVTNSPYAYEIRLYAYTNKGSVTNGLYYPDTNNLFKKVMFSNPNGSTNYNTLIVTDLEPGAVTNVTTYSYDTNTTTWTMQSYNGLHVESLSRSWNSNNTERTEVKTISETNGTVRYKEQNLYHVFPWGEQRIQQVIDPDNAALTSTWNYYTNSGSNGYSYLKQMVAWTGYWERYEYDGSNRITLKAWCFLNSATNASTNDCRVVTTTFSSSVPQETIVESLLGQEISRSYHVYSNNVIYDAQCQTTGAAWNASDNLITLTSNYTSGSFGGYPFSVTRPDGTMEFYAYADGGGQRTNTVYTGQPNTSKSAIAEGTKTVTVMGSMGEMASRTVYNVTNSTDGATISSDAYTYAFGDAFRKSPAIVHLDGTTTYMEYDCCGLASTTDKDGSSTQYLYDGQKRQIGTRLNNFMLSTTNLLDASGNVLKSVRTDTNGSNMTIYSASYDLAGRMVTETNALGGTNIHTYSFDGSGQYVKTTTNHDGGMRIETYAKDGLLVSISGTAEHPVNYQYGVDSNGFYTTEVKLTSGGGTNEWVKTCTDPIGRPFKTVYAASGTNFPFAISYFNNKGQLVRQVDPDSISTLFDYNAKGEQAYVVQDTNQNGSIDFSGADRIRFVTNDVVSAHATNVRRTRTYVWNTTSNSSNLVSTVESAVDGLTSWTTIHDNGTNVTSTNSTAYDAVHGYRVVTDALPDGTLTINTNVFGRLQSVNRYDSTHTNQIARTTFDYDTFGRQVTNTDARTGSITTSFNNADQINGVLTPIPASGQTAQVTSNFFDSMGRMTGSLLPDNTTTTNFYTLRSELGLSYGSRTYPVGFGYDAQGRRTSMTNWSSFSGNSGVRVTTWNLNQYRGWLDNKHYPDNTGPAYTYSDAGRLLTRLWARGTNTTYTYNGAGDLSTITYNDSFTPGVTNGYDRLGQLVAISNGPSVCALRFDGANQVFSESYTGGPLDGISVTNGYDSLLRRTNVVTLNGASVLTTVTNNYDAAGRILKIGDGTNDATYSYLANSPLVQQIVFTNSGSLRMTMSQGYDNLNRLTGITNVNASSVLLDKHSYAYNTANQRTATTNADSSVWNYGYDSLGQVTSGRRYWSDGVPVAGEQFGYQFDDIGNRTAAQAGGDANGLGLRTAMYSVNNLNQYNNRTVPGAVDIIGTATNTAVVTVNGNSTYRHGDFFRAELGVDNSAAAIWQAVTNVAVIGGATDTLATVTGNAFLSQNPESFSYDADGNLIQDGRFTYTWDAENRLVSILSLTNAPTHSKLRLGFGYDYQGRRTSKKTEAYDGTNWNTTLSNYFAYDGWNVQVEMNGTNDAIIRAYMWGLDVSGSMQEAGGVGGLLAIASSGSSQFTCFDGNGNIIALVDVSNGSVTGQYEYGPFGEALRLTGSAAHNPFRFSTKYADDETGLLYYGYRYCNTDTGKWLSTDLIQELGGFNLYGFLNNDPQNLVDLKGLCIHGLKRSPICEARITAGNSNPDKDDLMDLAIKSVGDIETLGKILDKIQILKPDKAAKELSEILAEILEKQLGKATTVNKEKTVSSVMKLAREAQSSLFNFHVYTRIKYEKCLGGCTSNPLTWVGFDHWEDRHTDWKLYSVFEPKIIPPFKPKKIPENTTSNDTFYSFSQAAMQMGKACERAMADWNFNSKGIYYDDPEAR